MSVSEHRTLVRATWRLDPRAAATVNTMNVLVAGGHGKIALRLLRLLAERGDTARGLIRNPDQAADLEEVGAEAVVLDLEAETADALAAAVEGSDAVVFAAGAGPGSGAGAQAHRRLRRRA